MIAVFSSLRRIGTAWNRPSLGALPQAGRLGRVAAPCWAVIVGPRGVRPAYAGPAEDDPRDGRQRSHTPRIRLSGLSDSQGEPLPPGTWAQAWPWTEAAAGCCEVAAYLRPSQSPRLGSMLAPTALRLAAGLSTSAACIRCLAVIARTACTSSPTVGSVLLDC